VGIFGRRRDTSQSGAAADDSADVLDAEEAESVRDDEVSDDEVSDDDGSDDDGSDDDGSDDDGSDDDGSDDDEHEMEWSHSRVRGPFDHDEVDSDEGYLDLGGLWVPAVDGMQLRLEVDEASQAILGAQVVLGASVIQLQAYAAPRTMGVWREIRTEIGQGVLAQGGTVQVTDGPFGKQLTATLKGGVSMRFLGVDGPRWFLRGVLSGPAATDDAAAERLVEVMRKVVVVRGSEAMAPRELLPMRLPDLPADADNPSATDADGPTRTAADLKPFERGPEITEVR
jgi:hypothetical protein